MCDCETNVLSRQKSTTYLISGMVKEFSAILVEKIIFLVCVASLLTYEGGFKTHNCSSVDISECNCRIFQCIESLVFVANSIIRFIIV